MGFCFSCCRSTPGNSEHEPLLHGESFPDATTDPPPPESRIEKVADAFGALRVGKLPSQEQINVALRKVLHSGVLTVDDSEDDSLQYVLLGQYGPLSERGTKVIKDIRELVEAVIQFGMEKNDDDRIQDFIYQNSQIGDAPVGVDFDAAKKNEVKEEVQDLANAVPSAEELDTDSRHLYRSLITLSRLLLTSRNFRDLLSDVLLTSRALLADAAAEVGRVAHAVGIKAETVEQVVRPDEENDKPEESMGEAKKQAQDGFRDIGEDAKGQQGNLSDETPDRMGKAVIDRIQKILAQAQETPAYKSSLHTLIYLLRKYIERANAAATAAANISASSATATPIITTDPHLVNAFIDLRILLERFASGRSLSPLILHLEGTLREVTKTSSQTFRDDLQNFFNDIETTIERSLTDPQFAISAEGRHAAEMLYEKGRELMRSNGPWTAEVNKALNEVDAFTHALASDRTTRRIIDAFDALSSNTADLFQTAAGDSAKRQEAWRQELTRDFLGWVLPRILNMLKTLPVPRVEMKSQDLDVVVEPVVLPIGASFVPDHILVQNWNEIRLNASAAAENTSTDGTIAGEVRTSTRTRIHIDGLRISAHRVGFYALYKSLLCGFGSWEDYGLMNVDIGRPRAVGEGLSVDIEIETVPPDQDSDPNSVYRVNDVKVDVPGLQVAIDQSKHWILNKLFVQPMAAPVVRQVLGNVFATQIRAALEGLNERMSAVRKEARHRTESGPTMKGRPTIEDYWMAVCTIMGSVPEDDGSNADEDTLETDTQLTSRGIVRNTRTQPDPDASNPSTPTETLVAIGVGAQILPGKGGPKPDVPSASEQAREALTDLGDAAGDATAKAKAVADEAVVTAVTARENLEEVSERMEARQDFERAKKGWRSEAFNL
ncbi:hypothetical protein K439DRAFT_1630079 [Ramaria rubella]|nr:hypothetical protein K439DRAFT_1630079 [Ramaria rubella]